MSGTWVAFEVRMRGVGRLSNAQTEVNAESALSGLGVGLKCSKRQKGTQG